MGVTISSWMTDSSGWQTMNRMQAATFSGDWRFSGGGGGSRILKKLVLIPPATTAITLTPCSLPSACSACVRPMTPCLEAA
jgi:hypothetical protein